MVANISNEFSWFELYPFISMCLTLGSFLFWAGLFTGRAKLLWVPSVLYSIAATLETFILLPVAYFVGELSPQVVDGGFAVCLGLTALLVAVNIDLIAKGINRMWQTLA